MAATTLSSREFNQKVGYAKSSARKGPVFITDRGQPTHVLLNIDDYRKVIAEGPTLGELIGNAAAADIDLEIEPRTRHEPRSMDFD
jgi:PHD/YefM family antitoxin component YafN of YafNO toxin-antitoxin module